LAKLSFKISFLGSKSGWESKCASACQISSKSVSRLWNHWI